MEQLTGGTSSHQDTGYFAVSRRPLHVLVFLLPLIIFYELGSLGLLGSENRAVAIRAERMLELLFDTFGLTAVHLPAIAIVVVLTIAHLASKDNWRLRLPVLAGMLFESIIWTLPLLILGQIVMRLFGAPSQPLLENAAAAGIDGHALASTSLPVMSRLTVSIGAGLYEELLFRMVGIALVHFVLHDLIGMKKTPAAIISIIVSAIAFAFYHDLSAPDGSIDMPRAALFVFAGLVFAVLYLVRGFGVAVGTHAAYDIAVLVILPALSADA
ncbi:MAG: CPBP family glutamic-type intramembrane protease [Planctomycetota bacterium]